MRGKVNGGFGASLSEWKGNCMRVRIVECNGRESLLAAIAGIGEIASCSD